MMLRFACALIAASVVAGREQLGSSYKEGWTLRVEESSVDDFRLVSMRLHLNGEKVESEGTDELLDAEVAETTTAVTIDRHLFVEDWRPTQLERTFVELRRTKRSGEGESEDSGVLEGRTLVLERGEDGDEVVVLEGEDDFDARFLEHFGMTYQVDALLPHDEVEESDSWSLESEDVERSFDLDESRTYFETEDGEADERDELMRDSAEGDVTVTFEAVEEHRRQR